MSSSSRFSPIGIAAAEFRRFRGPLPKIALVFVALVPLIYGAIYLAANWDPYGRLSDLPVAVVNQDRPATAQGRTITAGDDFVARLQAANEFDWHAVDARTAEQGLKDGDYYLVVTVPSDFSTNLVSGQTDDPVRAHIVLRRNDANGFVIGSITNTAQNRIEQAVDQSAVKSYFEVVFKNLATIRSGLHDAADGAEHLDDGLAAAHNASRRLVTGSGSVADGAHDLDAGASSLSGGLSSAETGAHRLSSGLDTMRNRSGDLANGADQVANGTQQLHDQVVPPLTALQRALPEMRQNGRQAADAMNTIADTAVGGSASVTNDLDRADNDLAALQRRHPELANDPAFQRLNDRVDSASGRADKIADAAQTNAAVISTITSDAERAGTDLSGSLQSTKGEINRLNNGAHQVASGARRLNTGISSASTGADTLAAGISTAATGASALSDGAAKLSNGADAVQAGSQNLNTALGQLSGGASRLHDQLSAAAKQLPAISPGDQRDAAQVLSSPAKVDMHVDNPATYYGRGLAPMFFSIALWVFGISAFLIIRPMTGRTLVGRANPLARQLGSWLPAGMMATIGGYLTISTVWLFLGLNPVHPLALYGITALGALAFSAIAHLLRSALGTPGSALLLVWLILQLASAGGTYPPAVLPRFFSAIHPYMPMSYLIDAFRVTISGGEISHLVVDALVLGSIAVAALVVGTVMLIRRQTLSMRDLHPPLAPA